MIPGKQYHIFNRGNNKQPIFLEKENYYYFLEKFNQYLSPYVKVHAYCLMVTHFHFLLEIKSYPGSEIETNSLVCRKKLTAVQKAFRDFFICYAKSINKKYGRTGALFQQKFRKKEINQRSYYTTLLLYIHLNPVEAGYCKSCSEWEFSSFKTLCAANQKESDAISWFGSRKEFLKAHEEYSVLKSFG
ncbi:MAG TPA: hypothetical protein VM012_10545 [Flavitalea sp.]|nr:hypothetical protein [Flavitalea sp.]